MASIGKHPTVSSHLPPFHDKIEDSAVQNPMEGRFIWVEGIFHWTKSNSRSTAFLGAPNAAPVVVSRFIPAKERHFSPLISLLENVQANLRFSGLGRIAIGKHPTA
ncbi:hypothetical protein [Paenibacillus sp. CECT 9249]|nr:hypothetical protein [Paenibacillus sp. CECT 9249]